MKSLAFCCLLLSACAAMNGAVKPAVPPEPPSPPALASPKPPPKSVLAIAPDDIPDGWARLDLGPGEPGEIAVEFGHFPENGYIRAAVIDGRMREVDAAEALAADIAAKGGRVSPVDRMNGDGRHAVFNVLDEKDGERQLHRFLFRPAGRGSATLFIVGIWPHAHDAVLRKDFDAIAEALALH